MEQLSNDFGLQGLYSLLDFCGTPKFLRKILKDPNEIFWNAPELKNQLCSIALVRKFLMHTFSEEQKHEVSERTKKSRTEGLAAKKSKTYH